MAESKPTPFTAYIVIAESEGYFPTLAHAKLCASPNTAREIADALSIHAEPHTTYRVAPVEIGVPLALDAPA